MTSAKYKPIPTSRQLEERSLDPAYDPNADEMRAVLAAEVSQGTLSVESGNQHYFDLIESKFPIGLNRPRWDMVDGHETTEELGWGTEEAVRKRVQILEQWFEDWGVSLETPAIFLGDDCRIAIHLKVSTFLNIFERVYELPQHMYLIDPNATWCIQLAMEGHMDGGLSANSKYVGEKRRKH